MIFAAFIAYKTLDNGVGPPPAAIASDPFLVRGREVYLTRCASCHGLEGRGDGPVSKGLIGRKPRDFLKDEWKYGTRPEQVVKVVSDGISGTSMGPWKSAISPREIRAASAYLFLLSGRPVPEILRAK